MYNWFKMLENIGIGKMSGGMVNDFSVVKFGRGVNSESLLKKISYRWRLPWHGEGTLIKCLHFCVHPEFMRDLFSLRETNRLIRKKYMLNLSLPVHNQVTFGSKSLRVFGPKIWNSLPYHIKSSENLESFKMIIKHWNGTRCNCKVCNAP